MKASVLICGQRDPGLPAHITGELYYRGVLADLIQCETMGAGTLRIRVEVECDARLLTRLLAYWRTLRGVQSIVATSPDGDIATPPAAE